MYVVFFISYLVTSKLFDWWGASDEVRDCDEKSTFVTTVKLFRLTLDGESEDEEQLSDE